MSSTSSNTRQTLRKTILAALFCALAYLAVFLFRFGGIGGFLTFDAKDAVLTLCGLYVGPIAGATSALLVAGLEAITISTTGFYGFLMNALSSLAFLLPASILYKYRRSMGFAIAGLSLSCVVMTCAMMGFNLLITPIFLHAPLEQVVGMLLPLLLPFNLTKAVFNAALVLLLYKPLSGALRRAKLLPGGNTYRLNGRSVLILIVSILLIVACCVVSIVVLGGTLEFFR